MRKISVLSGAVLAGILGFAVACGDSPPSDYTPPPPPPPPGGTYNCGGTPTGCDALWCQIDKTQEALTQSCAGEAQALCNKIKSCVQQFSSCFKPKCPAGSSTVTSDASGCAESASACVESSVGGGGQ